MGAFEEDNRDGVQDEDGEGDIDMDDEDDWAGIGGGNISDANGDGLATKVRSLEDAMTQMARGLYAVTNTINLKELANKVDVNRPGAARHSTGAANGQANAYDGVYDLDTDSLAAIGGKSDWDDLMARYDSAGEKEMDTIARGDIMPEKIYLCIRRDPDLFPKVTEETSDKVRWDENGPYFDKKGSTAYGKNQTFKNLAKALTTPMHFQHAWGWFMVLINYHYKGAALMSAMIQFAAEVVQFDGIYKWADCLKVYVNLARPILRGNLDQRIKMFKDADFALALSKCAKIDRIRIPLAVPSVPGMVGGLIRPTPAAVFVDGVEVCRRFNKGLCVGQCPHGRRHICLKCRSPTHKEFQCANPGDSNRPRPAKSLPQRPSERSKPPAPPVSSLGLKLPTVG